MCNLSLGGPRRGAVLVSSLSGTKTMLGGIPSRPVELALSSLGGLPRSASVVLRKTGSWCLPYPLRLVSIAKPIQHLPRICHGP
jgi:hypothetical protein